MNDLIDSGKFITFEGIDGSGKTSQCELLVDYLEEKTVSAKMVREPGGDAISESIRKLLLHSDEKMSDRTEALLMVASRAQLTDKVILPLLIDGKWVIADRYADSTIAYQGGGRGLNPNELDQINNFGTYTLTPDLTFYLDLPVEIANNRMSVSRDRIEREGENFQQRVRDMYLSLCEKHQDRFILLDGSLKKEEIHTKVCEVVQERLLK